MVPHAQLMNMHCVWTVHSVTPPTPPHQLQSPFPTAASVKHFLGRVELQADTSAGVVTTPWPCMSSLCCPELSFASKPGPSLVLHYDHAGHVQQGRPDRGGLRCGCWSLLCVQAVSADQLVWRAQATGKGAAPNVAEGLGGVNIKGVEDPKTEGREGEECSRQVH